MKHRPALIVTALLVTALSGLAFSGPVQAQLFQKTTGDQMLQDAEQKALSDPQAACLGFTQAADLYRTLSQDAARQANAISPMDPASRKMDLNRISDEAMRAELIARNRASQVCNLSSQPAEPKAKPKP